MNLHVRDLRFILITAFLVLVAACLDERNRRSRSGWTNYAPEYLDILEEWLVQIRR